MDPEGELCSAGADPGYDPNLVNAGLQPVKLGTALNISTSPQHSCPFSLSDRGNNCHLHPPNLHHHNLDNDNNVPHLLHQRSEPSNMPDTPARSTEPCGPSSLSEAHSSGLDPTRTPPIGSTKPSHRTPYQPSGLRRSSSHDQLRKLGGREPPFSPPFLHPLSSGTKPSMARSTFSTSTQKSKGGKKTRSRFPVGPSPPNSPTEEEQEPNYLAPKPFSSPFTIRGFLALSAFSKAIALLFACCVFLLLRAFLGIGHSAESCGVHAHEVTEPGPSSDPGLDTSERRLPSNGDKFLGDQGDGDGIGRVWLDMADETYGYRHDDSKFGEYEIEHEDDGGDHYDDEYEYEDFLDQA